MKNVSEYRITITLNEEEYNKLKYAAEYLKKYNTDNASISISKLSSKLISILIKALSERIEERTALLSAIDKESKEKNIKAMLENIQNDHIDSPKIIENLAFLSGVKKAIEKMEEDNTEAIKENEKTKNKDKENENKKEIEKETKKAEDKTIEEKQQKETHAKREREEKIETAEEIETKTESKENKVDDEEEIIRFPDL